MPDVILTAAREGLERSLRDLRACVEGAQPEALNWRPAGDDTNSIAVLTVHVMHSTRSWLSVAVGAPLPERDRASEFRASAGDVPSLLAFFDGMAADCRALLDEGRTVDWSAMRQTHARPNPDDPNEVTGAWALVHALEHLREHTGQTMLTRQLSERLGV